MDSNIALLRLSKTQKQYSFDVAGDKESSQPVKGQKNTMDGRKYSQGYKVSVSEVVCCTGDKSLGKALFRQLEACFRKVKYKSDVKTMVKRYRNLPSWDLHNGKTRLIRMHQNEKAMRHLAIDLLPACDRNNKEKAQAAYEKIRRDVFAKLGVRGLRTL